MTPNILNYKLQFRYLLILLCISISIIILADNFLLSNIVFNFGDVHHETFAILFFVVAIVIYLIGRKWKF
jgi:hypothetical protein